MAWSLVLDKNLSYTRHSITGAVSLTVAGWARNDISAGILIFWKEREFALFGIEFYERSLPSLSVWDGLGSGQWNPGSSLLQN